MFLFWIVVPIAILMSVFLIVFVLLQPSKGGGVGGAFGNIGSQLGSTFGSRRTLDFLAKGTTWLAASLGGLCLLANMVLSSTIGTATGRKAIPTEGNVALPSTQAPNTAPVPPQAPAGGGQQTAPSQPPPAGGGQTAP